VLGHLAANQRAAGLAAALGNAAHNLGNVLGAQLANGNVIQEEQRLRTNGHHVVDAHGHEVLAHRLVPVKQLRDGKLGAHAIRARDQHRVLHVLVRGHREARAKAAQAANDLGPVGRGDGSLDRVDGAGALVHVDTGICIRDVLGLICHLGHPS
jgi:hypothetical protein